MSQIRSYVLKTPDDLMSGLVIFNPIPNRFKRKVERALRSKLKGDQNAWTWYQTAGDFGTDIEAIKERLTGVTSVVVIGGDGTLHLAANALAGTHIPVGYLPCGSGNDFARFWFDRVSLRKNRLQRLVATALQGEEQIIDLGKVGNRLFINVAGLGFDGALIQATRNKKFWWASFTYLAYALFMLPFYKERVMELKAQGKKLSGLNQRQTFMLSIGNGCYYGGGLPITPHARLDDGLLAWCHVEKTSLVRKLWCLLCLFRGKHLGQKSVTVGQTDSLSVLTPGIPVQVDGEYLGNTPAIFSVRSKAFVLRR